MTDRGGLRHMVVSLSKVATSTGARLVGVMGLYALMARALGPAGFGQFTYWYATGILLAALSDFGFGQRALTSLAAGTDSAIREAFSALLSARLLTIGVALLVGLALAVGASTDWPEALTASLLVAACQVASVFEFLGVAMRARGAYGLETKQAVWSALVGNLVAGCAGYATKSSVIAAAVMLAFRTVALGMQFRVVSKQLGFSGPMLAASHRHGIFKTIRSGASFIADSAAVQAVGYVDVLLARVLLSEQAFGLFMACTRLMQALLTGIPIAASVFVPSLVRADNDQSSPGRQRLLLYGLFALTGLALAGVLALGAPWIGSLLFGHKFADLATVLPIFGIAVAARYFAAAPGIDLTALGMQLRRVWANVATIFVFAGTCFVAASNGTSFQEFAWLLCILSIAQFILFSIMRLIPMRHVELDFKSSQFNASDNVNHQFLSDSGHHLPSSLDARVHLQASVPPAPVEVESRITMKSIYLTGGWGYGNLGDNAILAGMLKTFSERLPEYEVVITSRSTKEIARNHRLPAENSIHGLLRNRNLLAAGRWLAIALWRLSGNRVMLSPALNRHVALMKKSSAVVLGGGGYFTDDWMDMLRSRYVEIEMASSLGIPVVIYGQTVGPFSDQTLKASLARFLNKVTFIAHRDVQSKGTLARSNYPSHASVLSADEANLLTPMSRPAKPTGRQPKVVIGVMAQKFRAHLGPEGRSPAGAIADEAEYIKNFVSALTIVDREKDNLSYKFIPSTSWDMRVCHEVARRLASIIGADKIETLGMVPADEFISACQNVDVMVSTNMHPVILASTAGKPSVAISYHYKLDDYMKSVGLEDYVARIDDFSAASLSSLILAVIERRLALAEVVAIRQPEVAQMARHNCDALIQVLTTVKA